MDDGFKKFFDAARLDERTRGEIEFVLNSPAYEKGFKSYMLNVINTLDALWLDRSQRRKDEFPDDYLAGGVAFGKGLVAFFDLLIEETSMERIHEAMSQVSNEELYARRQMNGLVKPVVGVNQPAEPLPPEEDF